MRSWLLGRLNNSRFGHWLGLHSPSRLYLGTCRCQRKALRGWHPGRNAVRSEGS